jgi:hypothetical protein
MHAREPYCDLCQYAVILSFNVHLRLVGLDFEENIARCVGIA